MGIKAVKFRGRHTSVRAIAALVIGILTVIVFIVLPVLSAVWKETPDWMGTVGMISALLALIGLTQAVKATGERDVYIALPIASMVVNGIALLAYVIIYVIGLV